ncbi:hypothetical protein BGZ73_005064 [Actinomortierella ambigua]|nr:hypothetical protein BGZ73_005064 [Actinomortierella ambigua]
MHTQSRLGQLSEQRDDLSSFTDLAAYATMTAAPAILVSRSDDEDEQSYDTSAYDAQARSMGIFLACVDSRPQTDNAPVSTMTTSGHVEVVPESDSEDGFNNDISLPSAIAGVQPINEHMQDLGQPLNIKDKDGASLLTPDATTMESEQGQKSASHEGPSTDEKSSMGLHPLHPLLPLSNFEFLVEQQSPPPSQPPLTSAPERSPPSSRSTNGALLDFASAFYDHSEAPTQRAYPLRKRTFQQRKPYTADKQRHLNLIRSRGVVSKRSNGLAKDTTGLDLLDDAILQNKSDEEDSDYEERQPAKSQSSPVNAAQHDTPLTLTLSAEGAGDYGEWEDDDGLPSLDQLRERILSGRLQPASSQKAIRNKDRRTNTTIETARILSPSAKKRLARLARQKVEPLLPVDVPEPFESIKKVLSRTYQGRTRRMRVDGDGHGKAHLGANSSTIDDHTRGSQDVMRGDAPVDPDNDAIDTQQYSDGAYNTNGVDSNNIHHITDNDEVSWPDTPQLHPSRAKRTKRVRQHVLPMSFFKRNKLPDDQNTLMSMRSQIMKPQEGAAHSSSVRRHEEPSTHPQLHHARTRMGTRDSAETDSLHNFMARLAEEGSDSDSFLEDNTPEVSQPAYEDDLDDFPSHPTRYQHRHRSMSPLPQRSRRPSWKDTIPANAAFLDHEQRVQDTLSTSDYEHDNAEVASEKDRDPDRQRYLNRSSCPRLRMSDEVPTFIGSDDSERDDLDLLSDNPSRQKTQGYQQKVRSIFTEERRDMIDRMQVRSGVGSASKGRGSRKRRRTSGRHRSLKAIRLAAMNGGVHRTVVPRDGGASSRRSRSIDAETDVSFDDDQDEWSDNGATFESFNRHTLGPRERQQRLDRFLQHNTAHGYDHHDRDDLDLDDFTKSSHRRPRQRIRPPHPRPPTRTVNRRKPTGITRAKVVPRQPIHKQKKSKTKSNLASSGNGIPIQTTLILGSQTARPQLFDKPLFQPPTKATPRHQPQSDDYDSLDDFVHEGVVVDDVHEEPPVILDTALPSAAVDPLPPAVPKNSRPPLPLRGHRTLESMLPANVPPTASIFDPLPNGVYFPLDSYIGRGRLAQLLDTLSSPRIPNPLQRADTCVSFQLFDEWFLPDWTQPHDFADGLWVVFYEFKRRCAAIQQISLQRLQRRCDHEKDWRAAGALGAKEDVEACVKALDTITTVLLERVVLLPTTQQEAFWQPFVQGFCRALEGLLDSVEKAHVQHQPLQDDPTLSPDGLVLIYGRWTLVTWAALFKQFKADRLFMVLDDVERDGQGYNLTLHQVVGALMRRLVPASGPAFCRRLNRIVASGRASTSSLAIIGEDAMEIWVCLIQLLDQIDDHDQSKPVSAPSKFWLYLNEQIQEGWMNGEAEAERKRVASDEWTQHKANHVLDLVVNLCRLHQFDKQGCTATNLKAKDNWSLIHWLAQHHWIIGLYTETTDVDPLMTRSRQRRLREFLVYCHSLLCLWRWTPSSDMVLLFYRYFAGRGFADHANEPGYRLPEFLKQLIQREPPASEGTLATHRHISGVALDISLLEQAPSSHDRCFEIYLKIVGLTVLHLVHSIDDVQTLEQGTSPASAGSFSSFRTTGHDSGVTGLTLEATSSSAGTSNLQLLSRNDKIRNCRRLLSSISPAIVTSFPVSRPSGGPSYSTLCNPCNLVLLITILVPDSVRPSLASHMQSFLDFDTSDDASQRIMLQAMAFLGLAWQRQWFINQEAFPKRNIELVLEFFFAKLHSLSTVYEQDLRAVEQDGGAYIPRNMRQFPVGALIETCLGYVMDLLTQMDSFRMTPYPPLAFLDQRLGLILNSGVPFPPGMRIQAIGIVEKFLELRKKHLAQIWQQQASKAVLASEALVTTGALASSVHGAQVEIINEPNVAPPTSFCDEVSNCQEDQNAGPAASFDDGFSNLDYEQLELDDDFSSLGDPLSQQAEHGIADGNSAPKPLSAQLLDEPVLELDGDLVKLLDERVLPWIETLLKERHQLLHDQNQHAFARFSNASLNTFGQGSGQSRPNEPTFGGRSLSFKGPLDTFATTTATAPTFGSRTANGAGASPSGLPNNLLQITQQGIWRFIKVLAKSSLILLRRGNLTLTDATNRMFKREVWHSLWIQAARQTDELAWATFLLEEQPQLAAGEHADYFLSLWFSTITIPAFELSLQHRFLRAMLQSAVMAAQSNSTPSAVNKAVDPGPSVSAELLKDLPFAHLDYEGSHTDGVKHAIGLGVMTPASRDILSQSLLNTEADMALLREFKEARLQILLKVLSNMGDHFTRSRVDLEQNVASDPQGYQRKSNTSYLVKTKYQRYLGLTLHQIKFDYERMELRRQTRDSLQVVDLAHHVIGHIIQHCGLILQNSNLTGSSESIFGFLTSPQQFPQPKIDELFLIQKIRGFAYLYQAGDRQFFSVLLDLIKNQLSKVKGIRRHSYADHHRCDMERLDAMMARTALAGLAPESEIRIMEGNIVLFPSGVEASPSAAKDSPTLPPPSKPGQSSIRSYINVHGDSSSKTKSNGSTNASKLAAHTLAASLRNVVSDSDDRRQWNKALGAFRLMVIMSITSPCLVAFWGPGQAGGGGSSSRASWNAHAGRSESLLQRPMPTHPELMMVSASVARALQDVLHAVAEDIALLPTDPLSPSSVSSSSQRSARLAGYEGFQRETSAMFSPIFQALYGTEQLIEQSSGLLNALVSDMVDSRLSRSAQPFPSSLQQQQQQQQQRLTTLLQSSDTRNAMRALHLAGQLFELLGVVARIARKTRIDFPEFYESNEGWREAFMDLIRGSTMTDTEPTASAGRVDTCLASSSSSSWNMQSPPAKSDVLSLESSLQEFVTSPWTNSNSASTSNGVFSNFQQVVWRDLQSQLRPMALKQDAQALRSIPGGGGGSGDQMGGGVGARMGRRTNAGTAGLDSFLSSSSSVPSGSSFKMMTTWAADCLLVPNSDDEKEEEEEEEEVDLMDDEDEGVARMSKRRSTVADKVVKSLQSCIFGFWYECAMLDTELYRHGHVTKQLIEERLRRPASLVEAMTHLGIGNSDIEENAQLGGSGNSATNHTGISLIKVQRARAVLANGEFTRWKTAMMYGRSEPTVWTAKQTRKPPGGVREGFEIYHSHAALTYTEDDILL